MDSTSLERLAALKRQLPQTLPIPDQVPDQRPAQQQQPMGPHPLETTQDPEQLFAELMNASPDGHVPAHLLKRLSIWEKQRAESADEQAADQNVNNEQAQYSLFEALLGDDEALQGKPGK